MNTLSNVELVKKIKELRGEEKRILALLLECLHELDNRKLYRELGYPSLFAFCTKALGYSEGAAFRRIAAARALSVCPELCQQIETGKLSLCTAAEVAKVLTVENKEQVLAAGAGKSSRAVKEALIPFQRESLPARRAETVRVKRVATGAAPLIAHKEEDSQMRFSITLELDKSEMALLEEAQKLLSARKLKDTVLRAAKQVVARDKRLTTLRNRRAEKSLSTSKVESPSSPDGAISQSRYIPADVRHAVAKRDNCQCSYIAPDGTRCCETRNLEYDHVFPFALGGNSTAENLRLVCRAHNQLYAEQVFGSELIQNIIHSRQ